MNTVKLLGALLLGLYLGSLPFLSYMFPLHNRDCPCHDPEKLIQLRLQQLQSGLDL